MTFNINDITMAEWCYDAALAVHADMKSYMGGLLTMDKGETKKMKQKINAKDSTEAELASAKYFLSHFLLTNDFLKQ